MTRQDVAILTNDEIIFNFSKTTSKQQFFIEQLQKAVK